MALNIIVYTKADKPPIQAIRNLTGQIQLIVKAIGKNMSYLFQISTDGINLRYVAVSRKP
jgi:hypothetical protein